MVPGAFWGFVGGAAFAGALVEEDAGRGWTASFGFGFVFDYCFLFIVVVQYEICNNCYINLIFFAVNPVEIIPIL